MREVRIAFVIIPWDNVSIYPLEQLDSGWLGINTKAIAVIENPKHFTLKLIQTVSKLLQFILPIWFVEIISSFYHNFDEPGTMFVIPASF